MVAAGTRIAPRPPHRSRRALLTHRAPTLDGDEEPLFGPRVCTENSVRIDYVIESPNVSGDDRSVLPLPGLVRLAVQVEEPTRGRERCTPTSADHIAAEGAWPRPAHER